MQHSGTIEDIDYSKTVTSPWMDTPTAARYLGCKAGTLKTWRAQGVGPRYRLVHKKLVRYHKDELDAYVRGE